MFPSLNQDALIVCPTCIAETKGFNHMGCEQGAYPTEGVDGTLPGSKQGFLMTMAECQGTREVQDGTVLIQAWFVMSAWLSD